MTGGHLRSVAPDLLTRVAPPLLLTIFFWTTSSHAINLQEVACAFALILFPWWSYLDWKQQPASRLPLFAMIASMHWLAFALPLFWGSHAVDANIRRPASEGAITTAMSMAVTGVVSLWLGMNVNMRQWKVRVPDIPFLAGRRNYVRLVMVGGMALGVYAVSPYALGEGARQIIIIVETIIPSTAFAILYQTYVRGLAEPADKYSIVLFITVQALLGVSSGWVGSAVLSGIVCAFIFLSERRRIPLAPVMLIVPLLMFLQVGKPAFRRAFWYNQQESDVVERSSFWLKQSFAQWSQVLDDGDPAGARDLAMQTLSRVSLLAQAANVVERTPAIVPYQWGKTYSYLFVTLVPRLVWPEKPSVSEANRFYQVAYGLTDPRDLDRVSISIGYLTEAYINFGWTGVVTLMFLIGVLLGIFDRLCFSYESGTLFNCIGFVVLVPLLTIESQLAQYLGGILQQILLTLLVLLPATDGGRRLSRGASHALANPACL